MKLLYAFLISLLAPLCALNAAEQPAVEQPVVERPMVVIIPSYKNAKYYKQNLDSVFNQNYTNYRVVYVADGDLLPESDKTGEFVQNYVTEKNQWHRFTLIRNEDRQLALKNWYKAVLSCKDEETVVALDGDDTLAHPDVLKHINEMYNKPGQEIWFTYGNYQFLSTGSVWDRTQAVPQDVVDKNALRQWGNGPTHLKTFKAWLFKQIKIGDLFYDDNFYRMAPDIAMYTPMIEMAIRHYNLTQEVTYIYNDLNVLNEHRVDRNLQWLSDYHVRHKPAYQPLTTSMEGRLDAMKQRGLLKANVVVNIKGTIDELREALNELQRVQLVQALKGVQSVYVVVDDNMCDEAALHRLKQVFSRYTFVARADLDGVLAHSPEQYVLLVSALHALYGTIDCPQIAYWLETTHAHAFYMNFNKRMFEMIKELKNITVPLVPVSLQTDNNPYAIYGWKYRTDCPELTNQMAVLLRKTDVQNGTIAMPDGGVGLFYKG